MGPPGARDEAVDFPSASARKPGRRALRRKARGQVESPEQAAVERDDLADQAVLDAQDQLVTQQETGSLEEGRKHDPAKVKAFLEKWKPEPLHAKRVLDDALATAGREDKRVFLKFSAQSCGWCVKFDQLLARPEVDAALRADLVVVTIDFDRMTGVADVAKRYQERDVPTSNWYAVFAPDGKTLFRSEIPMPDPQPGRSIGFPTQPEEVEHVVKMLTDGRKRMTDEEAAAVREAFTTAAASAKESPRK